MQMGLFDEENRLEKLSQLGDSLVRLNKVIQWEIFRPILDEARRKESSRRPDEPAELVSENEQVSSRNNMNVKPRKSA